MYRLTCQDIRINTGQVILTPAFRRVNNLLCVEQSIICMSSGMFSTSKTTHTYVHFCTRLGIGLDPALTLMSIPINSANFYFFGVQFCLRFNSQYLMMWYWETRLSRDEAGRRALTSYAYMCTDRATVIVVSPCHCMIDLVKGTGTKFEPHFSFDMLNYFRTNQYEEP